MRRRHNFSLLLSFLQYQTFRQSGKDILWFRRKNFNMNISRVLGTSDVLWLSSRPNQQRVLVPTSKCHYWCHRLRYFLFSTYDFKIDGEKKIQFFLLLQERCQNWTSLSYKCNFIKKFVIFYSHINADAHYRK